MPFFRRWLHPRNERLGTVNGDKTLFHSKDSFHCICREFSTFSSIDSWSDVTVQWITWIVLLLHLFCGFFTRWEAWVGGLCEPLPTAAWGPTLPSKLSSDTLTPPHCTHPPVVGWQLPDPQNWLRTTLQLVPVILGATCLNFNFVLTLFSSVLWFLNWIQTIFTRSEAHYHFLLLRSQKGFMFNVHIPITSFQDPYDLQWPLCNGAFKPLNVQWSGARPLHSTRWRAKILKMQIMMHFPFKCPVVLMPSWYDQHPRHHLQTCKETWVNLFMWPP